MRSGIACDRNKLNPDEFTVMSEISCLWDAKASLGEGPVWVPRDQAVYWVDIKQSMLHRYLVHDNARKSWCLPNMLSSIAPVQNDAGFIATFAEGVFYIDGHFNKRQFIVDPEMHLPLNRLNDGCCDQHGHYWFGSMDDGESKETGSFYYLDQSGQCELRMSDIAITNGPTFSQDGKHIYLTDTLKRTIYRALVGENSMLENIEPFICLQETEGFPDGMCTDSEGHLWVAQWGAGRVTRYTPEATIERVIELPVPNVSKCIFGGEHLRTLYMTTARHGLSDEQLAQHPLSGGLFSIDLDVQGIEVPGYAGKFS